jgi:hypothetical protein
MYRRSGASAPDFDVRRRRRAGLFGLFGLSCVFGFWLNETNEMNQINQINKTNETAVVENGPATVCQTINRRSNDAERAASSGAPN